MSTMIISENVIIDVCNSLIDHILKDSTKLLLGHIAYAISDSLYDINGGTIDYAIEQIRYFAKSAQSANCAAFQSQYYGGHDLSDYSKIDCKKIGIKSADQRLSMVKIAKQIDAIHYNTYDDYATDSQKETIAMIERVRRAVYDWIVTNLPEYDAADWG